MEYTTYSTSNYKKNIVIWEDRYKHFAASKLDFVIAKYSYDNFYGYNILQ